MFFNKKMAVSQIPVGHVPFSLKIQHEDIEGLLFCPFESRTSPFIAEVQGFGKSWAMTHGLIEAGTHLYEKLEMAAVDNLCAYSYPDASLEDLKMAIKWVSWLVVLDDDMDYEGTDIGRNPSGMSARNERLLEILAGKDILDDSGLANALRDFYSDVSSKNLSLTCFVKTVQLYLSTCEFSADNRDSKSYPLSMVYERVRLKGGAGHSVFELGFLMENAHVPSGLRNNALFETMSEFANLAICLVNDIFSCNKELKEGVVENLVILLQREKSSTFEFAALETARRYDTQVASYLDLKRGLRSFSNEPALNTLEDWISGTIRWTMETQRYR